MTLVLVPGLRGSAPDHWQEHLAQPADAVHLRTDRGPLDLDARVADLDEAVTSVDRPIIIAHSAGVLTLLHWAARAPRSVTSKVLEALLVTPPTLNAELPPVYPRLTELADHGWLPVPTQALPFPATVGLSDDDPLGPAGEVRDLAADWGAVVVELGAVGHANPASGHGPWPAMDTLVEATLREYFTEVDA
ncbi:MAG: alpha/beta hydrolase [Actinobacteria bacterium]|nr:alpha/beta hydrolase [Actinomycetota bacterium]